MSSHPLASDLIGNVIQAFRPHREKGLIMAPVEIDTLIRNLRTIQEIAIDTEQELSIQAELRSLAFTPSELRPRRTSDRAGSTGGANVVRLPTRVRVIATPSDGGDAA